MINSVFQFFIPAHYYNDPEELRQAKFSISVYLITGISLFIYVGFGDLLGSPVIGYANLIQAIMNVLISFLFRANVPLRTCVLMYSTSGTIYLTFIAYLGGGLMAPSAFGLILTPIYNLLLTNSWRSGLVWFGIIIAIVCGMAYYESYYGSLVVNFDSLHKYQLGFLSMVGIFINLFVLILVFEYQKNLAFKKLKKINDELHATQAQLIQKEKLASLGELTAGIAHEIQNPLNFVNNFSELSVDLAKDLIEEIKRPVLDIEYIDELLTDLTQNQEKINHHGKRASSIVKGMLEHSRTSTGEKELTDISVLCEEYLRLSYHGMRAKDKSFQTDFKTEFEINLPKISVVPQDIGRVLLNLFNNAFYAVNQRAIEIGHALSQPSSKYKPAVIVSTKKRGNFIEIIVRDNGTGMSESIQAKIFQPFFTTKPTGEGTGLGLSLSYEIITKGHSGVLDVESIVGEGTTFIIKLPYI